MRKKTDLSEKTPEEQKEYYKNRMLHYLGRRKTLREIRDYLKKLGCPGEITEELVAFSQEYGFADDEEYARCYIRDSAFLRHRSRRRIEYDLMQKGIRRDMIERLIEEEAPPEEEAIRWLMTRRLSGGSDPEACRRMGAYLQARGFSYEMIRRVMEEFNEEGV